ncbi:butyrophilin-like protein 2 isoform X2 [Mugil cephalus]|uniref:butyrophilin-like protein 2 isoform X2 n=1 Tax=Mugil cephalus TaxID=48193 RepID=UPI001FB82A8C|nr:butyrophilin-like protein 2 isoform X2 [Mugil cephalus]
MSGAVSHSFLSINFPSWVLTLLLFFRTLRAEHDSDTAQGSEVIRVSEGSDVILPCSLSTKESVVEKLFVWRKDEQKKKVFMYDIGDHYNNGLPGQDDQFRGRVSHFPDQLKFGNASIRIISTKITDSGDYTCHFPRINGLTFNMKLIVGSVPKPCVTILDVTDSGVQLKCEVQGAFPKPELRWKDSDGNILDAEEAEISERDGRYHITLQTTVTSTTTTSFQCVVQQKDLNHETASTITVSEKLFVDTCSKVTIEGFVTGMAVTAVVLPLTVFIWMRTRCVRGTQETDGDDETKETIETIETKETKETKETNEPLNSNNNSAELTSTL